MIRRLKRHDQSGVTLIELMFACLVLTIGMLGVLAMILVAIQSNGRNRTDTTGTMVAQMVAEQINVLPTNAVDTSGNQVTSIIMNDCGTTAHPTPTAWTVNVQAGAGGAAAGANLVNNSTEIDWTQTYANVPDGYKMKYYSCGDLIYEVRWHIEQSTSLTKFVVVSARQNAAGGIATMYAPPVTIRTISGP